MAVKIIYEDKDILVCEKPAGLAVQSARISEPDMVSELKNYLTGKQSAGAPRQICGNLGVWRHPTAGIGNGVRRSAQAAVGLSGCRAPARPAGFRSFGFCQK